MNDIEVLVKNAQAGNQEAANTLAARYRQYVYNLSLMWMKDPGEADSLAQDVLTHAYLKINQLECPRAYSSWLRKMTYRMAMNCLNRQHHHTAISEHDGGEPDAHTVLSEREEAELVRQAVESLRPLDRITITAYYFKNKSVKQLAEEQNAPIGTIKRRLHVARHRLRLQYEAITNSERKEDAVQTV